MIIALIAAAVTVVFIYFGIIPGITAAAVGVLVIALIESQSHKWIADDPNDEDDVGCR